MHFDVKQFSLLFFFQQFIQLNDISAKDAGTYICTASNDQTSIDYPKVLVVTGIVPYFAQAPISYLALPTLPDSYMHFSFEISFKPERGDGKFLQIVNINLFHPLNFQD